MWIGLDLSFLKGVDLDLKVELDLDLDLNITGFARHWTLLQRIAILDAWKS